VPPSKPRSAIDSGLFTLASQTFFNALMRFADFSELENKILTATHTDHSLSPKRLRSRQRQIRNPHNARWCQLPDADSG